ncbi:hypothetical protein PHJA_002296400 [Phtheirospermum japonicum]|uniref:Pre-rRNA-processing protein TSR2 homolog n=1 Tax=Phtheirospermum japonicum TaxID=374723 RepID=A0A830CZC3_9LAMI|nr:hypothetical protein PHJA_002296400 [Phtheirospermum japonicum]
MAVENEWGGRDSHLKSQQLGHEQVYIDDIEDMLDEFMLSLNTEIGDGSIEEIAEKMMVMHEECVEGNFDSIKKLKETNVPSVSYNRQPGSNDDDDSDDDDDDDDNMGGEKSMEMDVDLPQLQPSRNQNGATTDESSVKEAPEVVDGWIVVSSKRNKGRRN